MHHSEHAEIGATVAVGVYENFDIQDGMSEFKSPYRAAPTRTFIKGSLISTSPEQSSHVTRDKHTRSRFPPLTAGTELY